jgi:hypothetical protein
VLSLPFAALILVLAAALTIAIVVLVVAAFDPHFAHVALSTLPRLADGGGPNTPICGGSLPGPCQ